MVFSTKRDDAYRHDEALCKPVPTPEQAWDRKANVSGGLALYDEKRITARNWPNRELKDINKLRAANGLPACHSLPLLTDEQMARDTIRLYNCGHEYQWEPWNDPDCKGQWVLDPTCKITDPEKYDAKYVNAVLACDINH